MLFEPFVGQVFGDDSEDVNLSFRDVVVNAKIIHAEAILRLPETAKMLDAGLALFAGRVTSGAKMIHRPFWPESLQVQPRRPLAEKMQTILRSLKYDIL